LLVPGDAKALGLCDLNEDGWPDFIATRNDDTALAFLNRPNRGHRFLRVRLRGSPGNLAAIGARIRCTLSDGLTQLVELHAGSGYFTQSSAVAFFGGEAANAPKEIAVRWPDGQLTSRTLTGHEGPTLLLEHPVDRR
jgi:hypothetical protein